MRRGALQIYGGGLTFRRFVRTRRVPFSKPLRVSRYPRLLHWSLVWVLV